MSTHVVPSHRAPATPTRCRLPRRLVLVALCALPALAEALLARPLGTSGQVLAAQAAAPAPFGVFHDLRWLLVFTGSWPAVALWLLVIVVGRSGLTAAQLAAAWPVERAVPPRAALLRAAGASTVVSVVALAPAAGIQFGMGIASISYLYIGAVPAVFVLAVLLHPSVLRPWWRAVPTLRSTGWIVATALWLMVVGAGVVLVTPWARPLLAFAGGVVDAGLWVRLTAALVPAPARRARTAPVAPVGVVVLALAVTGLVRVGVGGHRITGGPSGVGTRATVGDIPVLYVSGFGDGWSGKTPLALGPGFTVSRFSYRGTDPAGRPRYYQSTDTFQPLPQLVAYLSRQVDQLHRRTGHRVALVAESEGELVAKAYLLAHPRSPVESLTMASPLVDPASVHYPALGQTGAGLLGAWLIHADSSALGAVTPLHLPTQTPLFRSVESHGPALRVALTCPAPGVRQAALFPLADAVSTPYRGLGALAVSDIAAFHGGMIDQPPVQEEIARFIRGGRLAATPGLAELARAIQAVAQTWDAPQLPATAAAGWQPLAAGSPPCTAAERSLQAWLVHRTPSTAG